MFKKEKEKIELRLKRLECGHNYIIYKKKCTSCGKETWLNIDETTNGCLLSLKNEYGANKEEFYNVLKAFIIEMAGPEQDPQGECEA